MTPDQPLSLFISSKMGELAEERRAVQTALADYRMKGWLWEDDAGARPEPIRSTFLSEVEACDIYIGLFWRGYGKYTIEEYQQARARNKPCLIYEKDVGVEQRDRQLTDFLKGINSVDAPDGLTIYRFKTAEELAKQVQEDVIRLLTERFRDIRQQPIWNVPYPINPFFTGREDIIELLHTELQTGQPQAIYGVPGVGKTQIALEYAHRYRKEYTTILWLRADTHEKLQEDARESGRLLKLLPPEKPQREEHILPETILRTPQDRSLPDSARGLRQEHILPETIWLPPGLDRLRRARAHQQETVEKVDPLQLLKKWLETENKAKWLLILDNVDDPGLLEDILPIKRNGHILLTTQLRDLGILEHPIPVNTVTPDEGAKMLLNRSQINTRNQTEQEKKANRRFANELSKLLSGLPLALDQAGAYMQEEQLSVEEYVALFNKKSAELLKRRGKYLTGEHGEDIYGIHPESVTKTFEISFDKIKSIDLTAAHILEVCAFLDSDDIPQVVLLEAIHMLSSLDKMPKIEEAEAIKVLRRYSLLQHNQNAKTYTIHRLLQAVLRDAIPADQQRSWAEKTIAILNQAPISFDEKQQVADKNKQQRSPVQLYLTHARMSATHIARWNIQSAEAIELLNRVGAYIYQQREYAQARQFYEQLLSIKKQMPGANDLDRARTLSVLANITYLQKDKTKYAEAEQMYQEALAIYERELPRDDLQIGQLLTHYAMLLRRLKRWREAEALAVRARQIWKNMTYVTKKRWSSRWVRWVEWIENYDIKERFLLIYWGWFYFALIGLPLAFGLLSHSWWWGGGTFILILLGLIVSLPSKVHTILDATLNETILRIVTISFYSSLIITLGIGGWIAGKNLLTLWQFTHWPVLLQFLLQGICSLVAVWSCSVSFSEASDTVARPRYTLLPSFTYMFSLCVLPISLGLLLRSWWVFGAILLSNWSLFIYLMRSWESKVPHQRTLVTVAFIFGSMWGYLGWALTVFISMRVHNNILQLALPSVLIPASWIAGFFCHLIAYTQLSAMGTERNISLALEDLWVNFDVATILNALDVPTPIERWASFYGWQGLGYRSNKRYAEAIASYTRAIIHAPASDKHVYYSFRGGTYLDQDDVARAIADFDKALELDPRNANAYCYRGFAYCLQNDYASAIADFDKALSYDPGYTFAFYQRGQTYALQHDYLRALSDFDKAIALVPTYALAYNGRGHIYFEQHDYPRALSDFDKAIALVPTFIAAYNGRAEAHFAQNDYARAVADFNRVIWLNPEDINAHIRRGQTYAAQGNYARAIADFDQAIALNPEYVPAYHRRADAYFAQRDYDHAIADYDKTIELDPKNVLAYDGRSCVYTEKHDYASAIADLDTAISLDPTYVDGYFGRGYVYFDQHDYAHAIADFDQAISLYPKFALAYNSRGNAYAAQGDSAHAIADFDQAILLEPNKASFYYDRGEFYAAQGDYPRAIADYDRAISLQPRYALAYNSRGNAYSKQGDSARANADYELAAALEQATKGPGTMPVPTELPEKDVRPSHEPDPPMSTLSGTEEELHILDTTERDIQNESPLDGKDILARVKQGNAPTSWQVYTDPNIFTRIIDRGISATRFIGLLVGLILIVMALFHRPWYSWLPWLPLSALILWGFLTAIVGVEHSKTRLVVMPEGFVYRFASREPELVYHYEELKDMLIQEHQVILIFKSGEQKTASLVVSRTALQHLQKAFLAFTGQNQSQFFIDEEAVFDRIKQGNIPLSWLVHTERYFPALLSAPFASAIVIAPFIGGIVVVTVVTALLHLPWHSLLLWSLLSILILAGLLTILFEVWFKRTILIITPEGFIYRFMFGEPDLAVHYEALKDMLIQQRKITLVFKSGEQRTSSIHVSGAVLQNLKNAYYVFKMKDQHEFFIDEKDILARVKQGNAPTSWQIYTDSELFLRIMGFIIISFAAIALLIAVLLHFLWTSWLPWWLLSTLILWGSLTVIATVLCKGTRLIITPEGFIYRFMFGEPDLAFHFETLEDMHVQERKITLVFKSGEQQTNNLSVSSAALQNLHQTYLAYKARDKSTN